MPQILKNAKNPKPYKREQDKLVAEKRDWALSQATSCLAHALSRFASRGFRECFTFAHDSSKLSSFARYCIPCSCLDPSGRDFRKHTVTFCNTPGSLRASVAAVTHTPVTICNTASAVFGHQSEHAFGQSPLLFSCRIKQTNISSHAQFLYPSQYPSLFHDNEPCINQLRKSS